MSVTKDKDLFPEKRAKYISVVIYFLLVSFGSIVEGTNIQEAIDAKKQGHYLKAIEYLLHTLSENPRSVEANVELGTNYSKRGELDQAIRHYQRAIELNPHSLAAHYNLGVVFARKACSITLRSNTKPQLNWTQANLYHTIN